jgi:hypothetical protein
MDMRAQANELYEPEHHPRRAQVLDGRSEAQVTSMLPLSRATGALLHPVTLTAIAVLLLNDHVFKHAWPDMWWTGKLSDFSWMVFAPPALALVLAIVVPRTPSWGNRVFTVTYVGLALLYLVYNLNEALHDAIMAAFALLTQAENTSPFDPTDVIVIPPALMLATWVWRRSHRPPRLRPVPAMIVLVVAGVASVATSSDAASYGIVDLTQQEDVLFASTCFKYWSGDSDGTVRDVYMSSNGGLTWGRARLEDDFSGARCSTQQTFDRINTSRGLMELRPGEGVFLVIDGIASLEVDMSFINDPVIQALTYDQLSDRGVFIDKVSVGLFDAEIAPTSENLVIATGHTGVLVGLPDGSWEWVRVGPYALTSQSPAARQDQVQKFRSLLLIAVAGFIGGAAPLLLNAIYRSIRDRRPHKTAGLLASAVPLVLLALIWIGELRGFPAVGPPGFIIFPYGILILMVFGFSFFWLSYTSVQAGLVGVSYISLRAGLVGATTMLLSSTAVAIMLTLWAQTTIFSLVLTRLLIAFTLAALIAAAFYILRRSEQKRDRQPGTL